MKKMKFILASKSPRRKEILSNLGLDFEIVTSDADESYEKGSDPQDVVMLLSAKKAAAVKEHLMLEGRDLTDTVIIAADTVVATSYGEILGKPKDRDDARRMIRLYSGSAHKVLTGVCIYDVKTCREVAFAESTDVYFRTLTDDEIEAYLDTPSPYDKAGAYGIQEGAAAFVSRIDGDYFNVVGLPVCRLCETLAALIG